MRSMVINELEMEALIGATRLQFQLYMVLRWWMDVESRRVGLKSSVSVASLARELVVPPMSGRHSSEVETPTSKTVRSALAALEKRGLVEPCGNGEVSVFLLPKATRALARPKKEGQGRGKVEGQGRGKVAASIGEGLQAVDAAAGARGDAGGGATLRYQVNPLSVEATAAALQPVGEKLSTGGVVLVLPAVPSVGEMAEWLGAVERGRGCERVAFSVMDSRLSKWSAAGITAAELEEAHSLAVVDRVKTKNQAAINPGFLDLFVERVLARRVVSRVSNAVAPAGVWHASEGGVRRRADELGLPPQRDGEDFEAFRSRVHFAHGQTVKSTVRGKRAEA